MDTSLTADKVEEMLQVLDDGYEEKLSEENGKKMVTAANNLMYCVLHSDGCKWLHEFDGFKLIRKYLDAAIKYRHVSFALKRVRRQLILMFEFV